MSIQNRSIMLALLVLVAGAIVLGALGRAEAATPIYMRTDGHDVDCNGEFDAPATAAPNCAKLTLASALSVVTPGGVINVGPGTFFDDEQVVITESVTITGAGANATTFRPLFSSPVGPTGIAGALSAWWRVTGASVEVNVNNLAMDASGQQIGQAIRYEAAGSTGTISNVRFNEITFNETGSGGAIGPAAGGYGGLAVAVLGGPVDVMDSTFNGIGRRGVVYQGTGANGSQYTGNTYTGKGAGNWLDYAVDVTGGTQVTIANNVISSNLGVASFDDSDSAGIIVHTAFGAGTNATIQGNIVTNSTTAIVVGVPGFGAPPPPDTANATIMGNCLAGNGTGIQTIENVTATASGNDIFNNDFGAVHAGTNTLDYTDNYWGAPDGPGGDGPGSGNPIDNTGAGSVTVVPFETEPLTLMGPCITFTDLSLLKSASAETVEGGDTFTYTLTVTNNGDIAAEDVVVTDTLPADVTWVSDTCGAGPPDGDNVLTWNAGSVAAGATENCTITVEAPEFITTLVNEAMVTSSTPDPVADNNFARTQVDVLIADLSVTKDGPDVAESGATVIYEIVVTNTGNTPAVNSTLSDEFIGGSLGEVDAPAGVSCNTSPDGFTCDLGDVDPGEVIVITVTTTAPETDGTTGMLNSVEVETETAEFDLSDNEDEVGTSIVARGQIPPVPPVGPGNYVPPAQQPTPTSEPTEEPTEEPTATPEPTEPAPTEEPTEEPTATATSPEPTATATPSPEDPTLEPTAAAPTATPTRAAPMPPDTGSAGVSGGTGAATMLLLLAGVSLAAGGAAFALRRRQAGSAS